MKLRTLADNPKYLIGALVLGTALTASILLLPDWPVASITPDEGYKLKAGPLTQDPSDGTGFSEPPAATLTPRVSGEPTPSLPPEPKEPVTTESSNQVSASVVRRSTEAMPSFATPQAQAVLGAPQPTPNDASPKGLASDANDQVLDVVD